MREILGMMLGMAGMMAIGFVAYVTVTSPVLRASYRDDTVRIGQTFAAQMNAFGTPLSDEDLCVICSCGLDGLSCRVVMGFWVDRGRNATECGQCALPSYGWKTWF